MSSVSAGVLRVLVCDDTRAHTELLADALRRDGELQVFSAPSGSSELIHSFETCRADVVLLSSNLNDEPERGIHVLRALRSVHGDIRAVLLLNSSKSELILEAFRAGARGVFSKEDSIGALPRCVRKVHEGQIWANTEQLSVLLEAWASSRKVRAVNARGVDLLSKRESEVVSGVAEGLTNREIAQRLGVSPHTVKNSLFRIFDKLGVSNRVELLFLTLGDAGTKHSELRNFLESGLSAWMRDDIAIHASLHAAERGALVAQIALAQFYCSHGSNREDVLHAYKWCSIVKERLIHLCDDIAKSLTVDQLIEGDEMIARSLYRQASIPTFRIRAALPDAVKESVPTC